MTPGLWGSVTAVSWGTSDFIARFSGRAVGHHAALFGMLLTGSILLSLWVWLADAALVWAIDRLWLIGLSGLTIMLATLWLYQGLARGPISVVAPIVGSYPGLIVVFAMVAGLRPSLVQWTAIAATMLGVAIVARSAGSFEAAAASPRDLRTTVLISLASATAFAVGVFTAQLAVPVYGELQTTWLSRLTSLAVLLLLFIGRGRPRLPLRWWPAVMSQGCLDTGGYLALYAGSHGEASEVAAVTASAFGAVTTLLAWIVLRERIRLVQWLGIALVFAGVAALSS
jgi:drug/metabolite transporter (DMT)-like permease